MILTGIKAARLRVWLHCMMHSVRTSFVWLGCGAPITPSLKAGCLRDAVSLPKTPGTAQEGIKSTNPLNLYLRVAAFFALTVAFASLLALPYLTLK